MNIHKKYTAIHKTDLAKRGKLPIFTLAVLLMSGCVKDELYNTPHPDKGAVQITTDWTGRSSDAVLPESYILRIGGAEQTSRNTDSTGPDTRSAGSEEQTVSGETNLFKSLLLPGTQSLLVYHHADGITINETTATVNTLEDGTLDPMPGFLFSAAKELNVLKDDTLKITVPMRQHIHSLTLTLKLNPGDDLRIAGTTAILTGITSAVDLITGNVTGTEGKTVVPAFVLGKEGDETGVPGNPVLTASLRLPGVMTTERQELTLAVALTNGTVQTIVTDLSEALKDFSVGELEPLQLDATLTLPAEAGFSATLSDWHTVENGDITVN